MSESDYKLSPEQHTQLREPAKDGSLSEAGFNLHRSFFAHTSPFRPGPRWARSLSVPLRRPSADTAQITQAALLGLRLMYEPGHQLAKAGVMLCELSSQAHLQGELLLEDEAATRDRGKLMSAVDQLNARYGRGTLQLAAMGQQKQVHPWQMRQERRTPHYTTDWRQIPVARA